MIGPVDADKPENKGQNYTASIKESSLLLDFLATGSILDSAEQINPRKHSEVELE